MKHNLLSITTITKKLARFSFTLSFGLFISYFFSLSLKAQGIVEGPIMLTGEHETACIIGGISSNGRYIFGFNSENSFRYDLTTKKSYYPAKQHRIVSVFDNGDMLIFVGEGSGGVITGADQKFTAFTSPDPDYPFVGPLFASADGKHICGNVAKEKGGFTLKPFVGIRQEDGSYKLSILEVLPQDVLGTEPQFTNAMFCSQDGKKIFGLQKDWTGFLDRFMVWEMGADNQYHIQGLDDATFFGTQIPLPNDFEFTFLPSSGRRMLPSFNGNYICAGSKPYIKDEERLGKESPYIYNLSEKKSLIFDKITDAIAINAWSDNELLCSEFAPTGGWDSFIGYKNGTRKPLYEWIKEKTGVDVSSFFNISEINTPVMGFPFLSADGKVMVTFRVDPNDSQKGNIAYMVFKDNITGINTPEWAGEKGGYRYDNANRTIKVDFDAQISLFDVSGCLLAHTSLNADTEWQLPYSLAEGFYIMQIALDGRKEVLKVAL